MWSQLHAHLDRLDHGDASYRGSRVDSYYAVLARLDRMYRAVPCEGYEIKNETGWEFEGICLSGMPCEEGGCVESARRFEFYALPKSGTCGDDNTDDVQYDSLIRDVKTMLEGKETVHAFSRSNQVLFRAFHDQQFPTSVKVVNMIAPEIRTQEHLDWCNDMIRTNPQVNFNIYYGLRDKYSMDKHGTALVPLIKEATKAYYDTNHLHTQIRYVTNLEKQKKRQPILDVFKEQYEKDNSKIIGAIVRKSDPDHQLPIYRYNEGTWEPISSTWEDYTSTLDDIKSIETFKSVNEVLGGFPSLPVADAHTAFNECFELWKNLQETAFKNPITQRRFGNDKMAFVWDQTWEHARGGKELEKLHPHTQAIFEKFKELHEYTVQFYNIDADDRAKFVEGEMGITAGKLFLKELAQHLLTFPEREDWSEGVKKTFEGTGIVQSNESRRRKLEDYIDS